MPAPLTDAERQETTRLLVDPLAKPAEKPDPGFGFGTLVSGVIHGVPGMLESAASTGRGLASLPLLLSAAAERYTGLSGDDGSAPITSGILNTARKVGEHTFLKPVSNWVVDDTKARLNRTLAAAESGQGAKSFGDALLSQTPMVKEFGDSFYRTGERLAQTANLWDNKNPYGDAWNEGRLAAAIVEDVGNVAAVGSLASGGLTKLAARLPEGSVAASRAATGAEIAGKVAEAPVLHPVKAGWEALKNTGVEGRVAVGEVRGASLLEFGRDATAAERQAARLGATKDWLSSNARFGNAEAPSLTQRVAPQVVETANKLTAPLREGAVNDIVARGLSRVARPAGAIEDFGIRRQVSRFLKPEPAVRGARTLNEAWAGSTEANMLVPDPMEAQAVVNNLAGSLDDTSASVHAAQRQAAEGGAYGKVKDTGEPYIPGHLLPQETLDAWNNRFEQQPLVKDTPAVFTLDDGQKVGGRVVSVQEGNVTFDRLGYSDSLPTRITVPVDAADSSLAGRVDTWKELYAPVWDAQRKLYVEGVGDKSRPADVLDEEGNRVLTQEGREFQRVRKEAATTDQPLFVNEAIYGTSSPNMTERPTAVVANPDGIEVSFPVTAAKSKQAMMLDEDSRAVIAQIENDVNAYKSAYESGHITPEQAQELAARSWNEMDALAAELGDRIEYAPARYRPALRQVERLKESAQEAIDYHRKQGNDYAVSLIEDALADMPDTLAKMRDAGIDPQYFQAGGLQRSRVHGWSDINEGKYPTTRRVGVNETQEESRLNAASPAEQFQMFRQRWERAVNNDVVREFMENPANGAITPTQLADRLGFGSPDSEQLAHLSAPELKNVFDTAAAAGYRPVPRDSMLIGRKFEFSDDMLAAPDDHFVLLPNNVAKAIEDVYAPDWFRANHKKAAAVVDLPVKLAKMLWLPFAPKWHVGNGVGNMLMGSTGIDRWWTSFPEEAAQAKGLLSDLKADAITKRNRAAELSQREQALLDATERQQRTGIAHLVSEDIPEGWRVHHADWFKDKSGYGSTVETGRFVTDVDGGVGRVMSVGDAGQAQVLWKDPASGTEILRPANVDDLSPIASKKQYRDAMVSEPDASAIQKAFNRNVDRVNNAARTSYGYNQWVDDMGHTIAMLTELKRLEGQGVPFQKALERAGERSLKVMGDFGNLTTTEKFLVKRVMPFYPWYRHITKLMFELPFDNPSRLAWTLHLGDMYRNPDTPKELRDAIIFGPFAVRMPWNPLPGGSSDSPLLSPKGLIGGMTPLVQWPAAAAGVDLRSSDGMKRPYGESGNLSANQLVGYGVNQFPLFRTVADVTGFVPDPTGPAGFSFKGPERVMRYPTREPRFQAGGRPLRPSQPVGPVLDPLLWFTTGARVEDTRDPEVRSRSAAMSKLDKQAEKQKKAYLKYRTKTGL